MFFDIPVSVLSSSALLGLTILLLLTGKLVPRVSLQDKTAEARRWQEAYEAEREARGLADAQTAELLELAKTTHAIISAMASTTERLRGGTNVVLQDESQRG